MAEITHQGKEQIVSPERLRQILRAGGETCFCKPSDHVGEWNAGPCPLHDVQDRRRAYSAARARKEHHG